MIGFVIVMPVINFVLICAVGSWLYRERRRNLRVEACYDQDRRELHAVANKAAMDAASSATVVERLGASGYAPRRRLRAVHDENTGRSSWHWE